MSGDLSPQEPNAIQNYLIQMIDEDEISQVELNWPQIGSQKITEYTTKNLMVMSFPELFLNGIRNPTTQA